MQENLLQSELNLVLKHLQFYIFPLIAVNRLKKIYNIHTFKLEFQCFEKKNITEEHNKMQDMQFNIMRNCYEFEHFTCCDKSS